MPRRNRNADRSRSHWHHTRQKAGSMRRTRTPKNTYAAKQSTRSPVVEIDSDLLPELGRKNETTTTPQKPKPNPKGGSKPGGTVRREIRRAP